MIVATLSGKSKSTFLLKITNDILLALDSGNVSLLTLLNPSAAFGKVDYCILLDRLRHLWYCTLLVFFLSDK